MLQRILTQPRWFHSRSQTRGGIVTSRSERDKYQIYISVLSEDYQGVFVVISIIQYCLSIRCLSDSISTISDKYHGICSHVLATGHINQVINLRRELLEIGQNKMKKKGGRARANPPPALTRVEQEDPDSSDEELYRLMEQGSRGQ